MKMARGNIPGAHGTEEKRLWESWDLYHLDLDPITQEEGLIWFGFETKTPCGVLSRQKDCKSQRG